MWAAFFFLCESPFKTTFLVNEERPLNEGRLSTVKRLESACVPSKSCNGFVVPQGQPRTLVSVPTRGCESSYKATIARLVLAYTYLNTTNLQEPSDVAHACCILPTRLIFRAHPFMTKRFPLGMLLRAAFTSFNIWRLYGIVARSMHVPRAKVQTRELLSAHPCQPGLGGGGFFSVFWTFSSMQG